MLQIYREKAPTNVIWEKFPSHFKSSLSVQTTNCTWEPEVVSNKDSWDICLPNLLRASYHNLRALEHSVLISPSHRTLCYVWTLAHDNFFTLKTIIPSRQVSANHILKFNPSFPWQIFDSRVAIIVHSSISSSFSLQK